MKRYLILVLIGLSLFGCTSISQSGIDCKEDVLCFKQAILDDCQDAYLTYHGGRYDAGADLTISSTKKDGTCEVTNKVVRQGQVIRKHIYDLSIPPKACSLSSNTYFINTYGKCVSFWYEYGTNRYIGP